MSKVVAKVKELWNQKRPNSTQRRKWTISSIIITTFQLVFLLDQTDLTTFSYTIKLPHESIPDYDTIYEKNQGVKINVMLIFNSSFITNDLSDGSRLRNFTPIQNTWKSLS